MDDIEGCIEKILRRMIKHLRIELQEDTIAVLLQFFKFGLIGLTNTAIYYLTNLGMLILLRPLNFQKDYLVANIVGFIISVLWSFYWNNRFVFKRENDEKINLWLALIKVFAAYSFTGLILSNLISYLLIDIWNWSKYIVPLINSIIGVPINFALNRLWAFKIKKDGF